MGMQLEVLRQRVEHLSDTPAFVSIPDSVAPLVDYSPSPSPSLAPAEDGLD